MMTLIFLIFAVLFSGAAGAQVSTTLSIAAAPPQAIAQGYSTPAFNGDFTQSMDMYCGDPYHTATETHQWYGGGQGTMAYQCSKNGAVYSGGVNWPATDPLDGSQVLDIVFAPNFYQGSILNRTGLATTDYTGTHSTNFPLNGYYECRMRMDAYSYTHMGPWLSCWMSDLQFSQGTSHSNLGLEYDVNEFHGGYPVISLANTINWDCRSTCYYGNGGSGFFPPGFLPTVYHTYGMLTYQTSTTNVHIKGYIDDVLIGEGDLQFSDPTQTGFDQTTQRFFLLIHENGACNWDEDTAANCVNGTISNIYADGSGNTRVTLCCGSVITEWSGWASGITDVMGVTSPINGTWSIGNGPFTYIPCNYPQPINTSGCSDFQIFQQNTNTPVPFTGTWTTGTGILNKWTYPATAAHTYVKFYRVWECANWVTTECSSFNPH